MKKPGIITQLAIDHFSATPKYLQLANSVIRAVAAGFLEAGTVMPSINELSYTFEISRDTAEKSYRHLKKIGILGSVPGKGYFVLAAQLAQPLKIFLIFNKLSAHKKIIYDAFVQALGEEAAIDFYIYNNDFSIFKKLLETRKDDYTHYVIIPHFIEGGERAPAILNTLPKDRLLLMDIRVPGVSGTYAAVYEDFENDIYAALEEALPQLEKYHSLKIIFPAYSYHPKEILAGFHRFCDQFAFTGEVLPDISDQVIGKGEAYINLMENDLVLLIEKIMGAGLEVGRDVGVISYNETPLKKIILNGITTMSTDFRQMGEQAAKLILQQAHEQVAVPFRLTLRSSL